MNFWREVGRYDKRQTRSPMYTRRMRWLNLNHDIICQCYVQRYASWTVIARVWPWPNRLELTTMPFAPSLYVILFNRNGKSNLTLYFAADYHRFRGKTNATMNIVDELEENSYFSGITVYFTRSSPFPVNEHKIHPKWSINFLRIKSKNISILCLRGLYNSKSRINWIARTFTVMEFFFLP